MAHRKRRRGEVSRISAVRPIDKSLVYVYKASVDGTDVSTDLFTCTFPGTVTGLRWGINIIQNAGTGTAVLSWAIVVVRDGLSASALAVSDAASFYEPEQDVLAFGVSVIDNNTNNNYFEGSTKTMRKLKGGDKLMLIAKGTGTNTSTYYGVVQLFVKS